MVERIASIMYLNTELADEYEKRHNNIWPEMKKTLKDYGATNYSIFLEKSTGNLFAYLEVPNLNYYNKISETDICKKWWKYMEPLMATNSDNSPITTDLREVFYMK
jgi:L-rhamnose mutarotase